MMAEDTPVPGMPGDEVAPGAPTGSDQDAADAHDAADAPAPRRRTGGARKKSTASGTTTGGGAKKPAGGRAKQPAGAAGKPAAGASAGTTNAARKRAPRKAAAAKVPAGAAGGAKAGGGNAATDAPGAAAVPDTAVIALFELEAPAQAPDQTAVTAAAADHPRGHDRTAVTGAAASGDSAAGVTRALTPVGRTLTSRRAPRLRTGIAAFLVVASVLAVLVSALGLWSRGIIFDTDKYVKVVAPVAKDPQVRAAVSTYVAAKAVEAADLNRRIESALPSSAKVLAPALTRSLQGYLVDQIDAFLRTPLAQRLWVESNRFAHEQLITALRDQNRAITVGRDDVKLNLLPLVAVAIQRLEVKVPHLLGRDVALPTIDPATAPDQIRILLQDALGRPLPADFGSVTLLRGSQGYEAKRALRLFNDLVILVVVVTIVLILAALLVSVRRWRTALWLGLGSLLAFVAARAIEVRLEKAVVDGITSQGGAAVARSIVGSAVASLNSFLVWIAVAGAIVAVAAFLAGRPEWLGAMGRSFAKLFGVASDLTTPDTGAGRWMAAHLDLLRAAGVAVAVIVLLFVTGSLTAVIVVVLALAAYELALGAYALGVPGGRDGGAGDDPGAPAA
jgi:hypothetical protein